MLRNSKCETILFSNRASGPWPSGQVTQSSTPILPTVQSKVEIDPSMQRDAGYYECQAYNKHAVDVKVLQLRFQ